MNNLGTISANSIDESKALKKSNDQWKDLHIIKLSESTKVAGYKKCIVIRQTVPENVEDEPFTIADIRVYLNGKPTKSGVSLTPFEYDWLATNLVHGLKLQTLKGKEAPRTLIMEPDSANGGIKIEQQVGNKIRRINLVQNEINSIINKYGNFFALIEEIEN
jgi:hypothetical protein